MTRLRPAAAATARVMTGKLRRRWKVTARMQPPSLRASNQRPVELDYPSPPPPPVVHLLRSYNLAFEWGDGGGGGDDAAARPPAAEVKQTPALDCDAIKKVDLHPCVRRLPANTVAAGHVVLHPASHCGPCLGGSRA